MSDLDHTKVVLVVFAMPGCPACEDYLPRLYKAVEVYQSYGHPFVVYDLGMRLQPGQIPVVVYDSTSQNAELQAFADQHKISGLPTTLLLPQRGRSGRWEGGLNDADIYSILRFAVEANH